MLFLQSQQTDLDAPSGAGWKASVQTAVRRVHAGVLNRGLPTKVGVYFHSLEPADYDAFREMAAFFHAAGYRFTGPEAFLADPDEPAVFVSFDDNYRAWYQALPLLRDLEVPATFYVNTAFFRDRASAAEIEDYFDRIEHAGERATLSTDELRAIAAAGHTIGAHTHTHPCLTAIPPREARAEIHRSKVALEALLGRQVVHFSYPFGMRRHFDERLRTYCLAIGLTHVANAVPGVLHRGQAPEALQRTGWKLDRSCAYNVVNCSIDGSLFERLTGRSALG